ncbi:MAG: hypothetical protein O7E52_03435 [Candidatus Poribacteria bacterium]|nr:hypothetical protein [Candidatus Poribacteria bacterium]
MALRIIFKMRRCLLILFMLSVADSIYAVEEQASTGVRAIGFGEAFIGLADDENSVRRNPAGLTRLDRYAIGLEQTPSKLFDALKTSYLSVVLPASEKMALGFDWLQVGIDDEELDASRDSFNFAYSYSPLSLLSLGLNLKYFTWAITLDERSEGNATGWGTDVGVLLQLNRHWSVGFLAQDLIGFGAGEGLSRDTWIRHDTGVSEKVFPTAYKLGVAYRPTTNWLVATDITDRVHVGAEFLPNRNFAIRAGFQKDLHTPESPTYSLGGSVRYKWMNFNLAYLIPPTLPPTAYVGLSLNFDFRKLPVIIEHVRMRNLYPVHYNYYFTPNRDAETVVLEDPITPPVFTDADRERYYPLDPLDSIGRIWLKNVSNKPITVRIELFIDQFVSKGGTEVASDILVPPLTRVSVSMRRLALSRKALALPQAQRVEARIRVIESGGTAYRTSTTSLKLHGNHTTILDDVAKLGSFISSEDPAIHAFRDAIFTEFKEEIEMWSMPTNLYKAMLLFSALHGISYATDPNIPGDSGTIDDIKYPHEMLERLMGQIAGDNNAHTFGDCDDSTALYCSLLESTGIQTALIQLPNHVMMAFSLGGISLDRAQEMNLPDVFYQPINGQVWIPVETTLIKDGFAVAWKTGIESIRTRGVIDSIAVQAAWDKYGESTFRGTERQFSIPKDQIQKRIDEDLTRPWLQEFLKYFSEESTQ